MLLPNWVRVLASESPTEKPFIRTAQAARGERGIGKDEVIVYTTDENGPWAFIMSLEDLNGYYQADEGQEVGMPGNYTLLLTALRKQRR